MVTLFRKATFFAALWMCSSLLIHCVPSGSPDTLLGSPSGKGGSPDTLLRDSTSRSDSGARDSIDILEPTPVTGGPIISLPDPRMVHLVGRVVDREGMPLADAITQLARYGLTDTTDAEGRYELLLLNEDLSPTGSHSPVPKASGAVNTAVKPINDSLRILKERRVVAILAVPGFRDSLPDIKIIQRTMTGKVGTSTRDIARVEADIWTFKDAARQPWDLEYNRSASTFSGVAYFIHPEAGGDYRACVSAYADDGALLGHSDSVSIGSDAGDIEFPLLDAMGAFPVPLASASPSIVSVEDPFLLKGTAFDPFGGFIAKWEWDAGNVGSFRETTPDSVLAVTAPINPDEDYECVLRVTDLDGHAALDTVTVKVIRDDPSAHGFQVYWGDVHSHSGFSSDFRTRAAAPSASDRCLPGSGCGGISGPDLLFDNARGANLDFAAVTDHAEDLSSAQWEETKSAVRRHDSPGSFVPFLGYEYCDSIGTLESCLNILFPSTTGAKVFAGRTMKRIDSSDVAEYLDSEREIWANLQVSDPGAIGIVAHPPTGTTWDFSPLKRQYVLGAEISSTGGSPSLGEARLCQSPLLDGLRQGLALQVFGSGNDHEGKPGRASLTAALAKDLTRESLFEAFRARRTYATRGSRIAISFEVDGRLMGSEYVVEATGPDDRQEVRLSAEVVSRQTPLQSVSFFRLKNGIRQKIREARKDAYAIEMSAVDTVGAGETSVYWAEVLLKGQDYRYEAEAWTSPVTVRMPRTVTAAKE